ncbi:MAG: phosphatase PAP2 family protein [Polyangiaceae bacterium]
MTSDPHPQTWRGAHARRWAALVLVGLVSLELLALTGIAPPPHDTLRPAALGPFLAGGFFVAFLIFLGTRPRLPETGAVLGAAALLLFMGWPTGSGSALKIAVIAGASLGEAALLALAVRMGRPRGEARRDAVDLFAAASLLPGFIMASGSGMALTTALHPFTYDGAAYLVDAGLGFQPSFAVGRSFLASPAFGLVCALAYGCLPLSIGALLLIPARPDRPAPRADLLESFLLAGVLGCTLYHFCPVAGPYYAFGAQFPSALPDVVPSGPFGIPPAPRDGVPSLHAGWAILVLWQARARGRAVHLAAGVSLALILLGALGLGEHYVGDFVVAVPFVVAVDALTTYGVRLERPERWQPIALGFLMVIAWIVALRTAAGWLSVHRAATWALMTGYVAGPLALRRRLQRCTLDEASSDFGARAHPEIRREITASVLRFGAGFGGLAYAVALGAALAPSIGGTTPAACVLLATALGSSAAGAFAAGLVGAPEWRRYALVLVATGALCALTPLLLLAVGAVYAALGSGENPPVAPGIALTALAGGIVVGPTAFLAGAAAALGLRRPLPKGRWAGGVFHGANALGGAAGAFVAGCLLVPALGCRQTMLSAGLLIAVLGCAGLRPNVSSDAHPETAGALDASARARGVALAVLAAGGSVSTMLALVYAHLLAVVAGTSVYALVLGVVAVLLGLATGSGAMFALRRRAPPLLCTGVLALGLAAAVLLGVPRWESIPTYFASFAEYPLTRTFAAREVARFAVLLTTLGPPAILVGALRSTALGAVMPRSRSAGVALFTVGGAVGALVYPALLAAPGGSVGALRALAIGAALIGLMPLVARTSSRSVASLLVAGAVVIAFAVVPSRKLDLKRVASGANVHFKAPTYGDVVDSAESAQGGIVTVARSVPAEGEVVLTLLADGHSRGDDGMRRDPRARYAPGLLPLAYDERHETALVIGVGTGATARVMRDAGFSRTDVIESSDAALALAVRDFRSVNGGALDDPTVHSSIGDARSFLLLQRRSYDVIAIDRTSVWSLEAAPLYDRELYAAARARLAPGGVMEQWIQLNHVTSTDLVTVVATMHAELSTVWVFVTGMQAMLVGCPALCEPKREALAALQRAPLLAEVLAPFGGTATGALEGLVLAPPDVERLLSARADDGSLAANEISSDDNLRLAYSTPQGSVLRLKESVEQNVQFLRTFARRQERAGPAEPGR